MVEAPADGVPNVKLQEAGEEAGVAEEASGIRERPVAEEEAAESGSTEDVMHGLVDEDEIHHALAATRRAHSASSGRWNANTMHKHAERDVVDDAEGPG
ncbi:hypothetical protein E2562_039287 [Oryza meyeriana var. granulata]|uniref:Uncharacterized protein n=1 Tax=Oryza meyeriana var. granulata TaxID=110450 RepID=A0A6G1DW14_9ORYZ|nr:hypothetical protein E2562_039287 [Oryza meyeriana var. granulata]